MNEPLGTVDPRSGWCMWCGLCNEYLETNRGPDRTKPGERLLIEQVGKAEENLKTHLTAVHHVKDPKIVTNPTPGA